MRKLTLVSMALLLLAGAALATSGNQIQGYKFVDGRYDGVLTSSGAMVAAKADTIYLIGGPDRNDGKFQNDFNPNLPDDEGWVGVDLTAHTESKWHIDTYNCANLDPNFVPNHAMWAGEYLADDCGTGDFGGYSNGYQEYLDWVGTVADPGLTTNVTLTGILNYDNEPGYDYLYLVVEKAGVMTLQNYWNGNGVGVAINEAITVAPGEYANGNEVHLRFMATSDGGWSDEDCYWPTMGHSQLDNLSVSGDNGLPSTYDNFESGMVNSSWQIAFPPYVGNFAQVWAGLTDLDPCNENITPQFAFLDDGVVVPCTGPSYGTTWTYGPNGYIVNTEGGCAGPSMHINNEIWSPALEWPAPGANGPYVGALYTFDVYRHFPLTSANDPGTFYVWHVRSSTDGGATWGGWNDRNFVYYGGPDYIRVAQDVTDLIDPGATHVQLALGVYELGWVWGFDGSDGTPAPYFDNVAFAVYAYSGPGISTRELELAQDNFPASGDVDLTNLASNSIRFDMANDIEGSSSLAIVPGDSITFFVTPVRPGSVLNGRPVMHYKFKTNPLFDAVRDPSFVAEGDVLGDTVRTSAGSVVENRFSFDLPDSGWFFPGDIIHYYIYAEDNVSGDVQASTLPSDLTGFGVFPGDPGYVPLQWSSSYTVHGLPTVLDASGTQPSILFWNDFGNRGNENEWYGALNALGYVEGVDYDVYYTNAPSSGVSNGLGSRATLLQLQRYNTLLYSVGDLDAMTLAIADTFSDKSNDIDLIDQWLQLGRNFLAMGDGLAYDMTQKGTAGLAFLQNWLGADYQAKDVADFLGGDYTPDVVPVAGNPVGFDVPFVAYGTCPVFHEFNAVNPATGANRIAEWQATGAYPYAAGLNVENMGSKVVFFPIGFSSWRNPAKTNAPNAARTEGLSRVLIYFSELPSGSPTGADTPGLDFSTNNYPNPFNPSTKIEYTMPRAGHVSIKIYNLKGELVRTLVDASQDAGRHTVVWDGTNDHGASVASGVYFYETRTAGKVAIQKMALVK